MIWIIAGGTLLAFLLLYIFSLFIAARKAAQRLGIEFSEAEVRKHKEIVKLVIGPLSTKVCIKES